MALVPERRKMWRAFRHQRWTQFACRSVQYEAWSKELWATLQRSVSQTKSGDVLPNMTHAAARSLLEALESEFPPVEMSKKGHAGQLALDAREFLELGDEGYRATDEYANGLFLLLQAYICGALLQLMSKETVVKFAVAIDTHDFSDPFPCDLDVRVRFGCTLAPITRFNILQTCLKLVKPTCAYRPNPHQPLDIEDRELVRMANVVMRMLMTGDRSLPLQHRVGALLMVSLLGGEWSRLKFDRARFMLP